METSGCLHVSLASSQLQTLKCKCPSCLKLVERSNVERGNASSASDLPSVTPRKENECPTAEYGAFDRIHHSDLSMDEETSELQEIEDIAATKASTLTLQSEPPNIIVHKKLHGITNQIFAAITVSIASVIVGFSNAYTSPALVSMAEPNSTIRITPQQESWIGSLMPLSALGGGIVGGILIDWLGRKSIIIVTGVPFVTSWLLIGMAKSVTLIYVGRSMCGFGVGIISLAIPVYIGETIQPEMRGTLNLVSTSLGNMGILFCYMMGNFLNWSNLALLGSSLPVPLLVLAFFIPETPRWYISKRMFIEGKTSLMWLRGNREPEVDDEMAEIERNHNNALSNSSNNVYSLFTKGLFKPIFISFSLMVFQQFSGINAVIFYTVKIFQDAGSSIDKNLATIVVGAVNLASTFLATVLIERLGRRLLLSISAVSMAVSLTVLGTFFYLRHIEVDLENYGWLPLLSFVVFVVGFSTGFGPIPWLMLGEIFPAKIRGLAASLAAATNWTCTFLVTKMFNNVLDALGTHGAFWMLAVVCFVSLFFVLFFVPETRGRSLEDIEQSFKQNMNVSNWSITGPPVKATAQIGTTYVWRNQLLSQPRTQ